MPQIVNAAALQADGSTGTLKLMARNITVKRSPVIVSENQVMGIGLKRPRL